MNPILPKSIFLLTIGGFVLTAQGTAQAGGKVSAVRQLVETVRESLGKKLTRETGDTLPHKLEDAIARYGDAAAEARRKIGPAAAEWVERAGDHAPQAIRLMARRGDEAIWVVSQPRRLAIFVRHGDDAAEAMIRHREIVEPLLESFGKPAAKALANVNSRNARRIAMMAEDGDLATIGRTPELLRVVGRFGDRAMEFLWKHKAALTVGAALAAFLNDPEPFLDGTRRVVTAGVESIGGPIADQAARRINWSAVSIGAVALVWLVVWRVLPRRTAVRTTDRKLPAMKAVSP